MRQEVVNMRIVGTWMCAQKLPRSYPFLFIH